MKIVKLSHDFTPLREGILFGIDTETDEPSELEVKIIEMATGEVVATKLLRNATTATINIAPYIEFLEEYCPASNQCSFAKAPTASYKICVGDSLSEEVVVSVNRRTIDSTPAVVSSLPNTRRIARGEEDEVLILAEQGRTIYAEIVADTGEMLHLESHTSTGATILTIATDDFDTAISTLDIALYCDGEEFGRLHYSVTAPLKTSTRLAWVSDSGAIERYSFPSTHKSKRLADKQTIAHSDGVVATQGRAKQFLSLCSRIEPAATVAALAEIVSSPKVWIEHDGAWHSVEVVTPQVEYNLFGEPSLLHFDICLWQKEVSL